MKRLFARCLGIACPMRALTRNSTYACGIQDAFVVRVEPRAAQARFAQEPPVESQAHRASGHCSRHRRFHRMPDLHGVDDYEQWSLITLSVHYRRMQGLVGFIYTCLHM